MKRYKYVALLITIGIFLGTTACVNEIYNHNAGVQSSGYHKSENETIITEELNTVTVEADRLGDDTEVEIPFNLSGLDLASIPEYTGSPYIILNDDTPGFGSIKMTTAAFEEYSMLDKLGRCGQAFANICREIMPTEERGPIGDVKPTGWKNKKYGFIDGNYLYNRCHLIGFELAGENANEKNLITGTRYLNVEGMKPFERNVADYVYRTGNHVLYRVTPMFYENELVARGVQIEAYSVEDKGKGICFNVFCYNVQPGVIIDYATGSNQVDELNVPETVTVSEEKEGTTTGKGEYVVPDCSFVLNTNTLKFHRPECDSVKEMSDRNKEYSDLTKEELLNEGYSACGFCNP